MLKILREIRDTTVVLQRLWWLFQIWSGILNYWSAFENNGRGLVESEGLEAEPAVLV